MREPLRGHVEDVEAAVLGADVDEPVPVAGQLHHLGDAQRVGAPRIGQVASRSLAVEIDADEARTVAGHPQRAGRLLEERGEERVVGLAPARRRPLANGEAAERVRGPVELEQAAPLRGHPERAARVLQHRHHPRLAAGGPDREGRERLRGRVEEVDALGVPDPQASLAILVDRLHVGRAQGARPPVRQVAREPPGAPVQHPDARPPARGGADPEAPLAVLEQAGRLPERKAAGVVRVVAVDDEARAVVANETARRREPHEAVAVLDDGPHVAVRQAVLDREVAEGAGCDRGPRRGGRGAAGQQQRAERVPGQSHRRSGPGRGADGGAVAWVVSRLHEHRDCDTGRGRGHAPARRCGRRAAVLCRHRTPVTHRGPAAAGCEGTRVLRMIGTHASRDERRLTRCGRCRA